MKTTHHIFLLLIAFLFFNGNGSAQDMAVGKDYVIFEAEGTSSALGEWNLISSGETNFVNGASGGAQLEFTGNGPNGGSAKSPLNYTFTCPKSGTYRMVIRCRKRLEGEESDKCNDGWVKLAGNYSSGNDVPVADLSSNEKFFGGAANGWGWANQLDWQGHIKRPALYVLTEGETYTFTISGRSIRWNIDYILFYDTDAYTDTEAKEQLTIANHDECKKFTKDDWDYTIGGFVDGYIDGNNNCIGINTVQQPTDSWAAAETHFDDTSGTYHMVFTSLQETDGECSYRVIIDGDTVLDFTNPRIHGTSIPDYTSYRIVVRDVTIDTNDLIHVEYISHSNELVEEGVGWAYARGRWRSISFGDCEIEGADRWYSTDTNDVDGDLVADSVDNCPDKFNPNQDDIDGDGKGDVCDPPPVSPSDLVASIAALDSIQITWSALEGELGCYILRKVSLADTSLIIDSVGADITSYYDTSAQHGVLYMYSLIASYPDDEQSLASDEVLARLPHNGQEDLPDPWESIGFGNQHINMAGLASFSNDTFTIDAGNGDFWTAGDVYDRGHFIYKKYGGNFQMVTKILTETEAHDFAQGGLMARESLSDGSKFVSTFMVGTKGPLMRDRVATNGATNQKPFPNANQPLPVWLKLQRGDNVFSGFYSTDGTNWQSIRSVTVTMPDTVYIGLAAASHTEASNGIYTFKGFDVQFYNSISNISASEMVLYPNPAKQSLTIENIENAQTISVLNLDGRLVYQTQVSNTSEEIQLNEFTSGYYILKVLFKNGSVVAKSFIKE